jgi:hypothetical protein
MPTGWLFYTVRDAIFGWTVENVDPPILRDVRDRLQLVVKRKDPLLSDDASFLLRVLACVLDEPDTTVMYREVFRRWIGDYSDFWDCSEHDKLLCRIYFDLARLQYYQHESLGIIRERIDEASGVPCSRYIAMSWLLHSRSVLYYLNHEVEIAMLKTELVAFVEPVGLYRSRYPPPLKRSSFNVFSPPGGSIASNKYCPTRVPYMEQAAEYGYSP